jgi:hypothetical protein
MSAFAVKWWNGAPALRFLMLFLLFWVGVRAFSPEIWAQRPDMIEIATRSVVPMKAVAEGLALPEVVPLAELSGADAVASFGRETADRPKPPPLRHSNLAGAGPNPVVAKAREWQEIPPENPAAYAPAPSSVMVGQGYGRGREALQTASVSSAGFARQMAGWSLSAWALVRDAGGAQTASLAAGELAGSQAGARLAYGFGASGRLRVYARASMALEHRQQSEAAVGISYALSENSPVDVAVERREKLGDEGRSAMALMLVGGVSGKPLPLHFRLDAYGQAGVVGMRSRDTFVDGALVVDRSVDRNREASALRVGAVLAVAAQPHLSRIDVGPRITLPLPNVGKGARVALDWRERVAGNAKPDGGLALTLGADF